MREASGGDHQAATAPWCVRLCAEAPSHAASQSSQPSGGGGQGVQVSADVEEGVGLGQRACPPPHLRKFGLALPKPPLHDLQAARDRHRACVQVGA